MQRTRLDKPKNIRRFSISVKVSQKATDKAAGSTPLHLAVARNCLATTRFLLETGANVVALDQLGNTPLHLAVKDNRLVLAELLLKHDAAAVSLKSPITGYTPLQVAVDHHYFTMASVLRRYGAELSDLFCHADTTLLNLYISRGDLVKTQWLLAEGASLDVSCQKYGYYPMDVAHLVDHQDILNLLLRHQSDVISTRFLAMANDDAQKGLAWLKNMFLPMLMPHSSE